MKQRWQDGIKTFRGCGEQHSRWKELPVREEGEEVSVAGEFQSFEEILRMISLVDKM